MDIREGEHHVGGSITLFPSNCALHAEIQQRAVRPTAMVRAPKVALISTAELVRAAVGTRAGDELVRKTNSEAVTDFEAVHMGM